MLLTVEQLRIKLVHKAVINLSLSTKTTPKHLRWRSSDDLSKVVDIKRQYIKDIGRESGKLPSFETKTRELNLVESWNFPKVSAFWTYWKVKCSPTAHFWLSWIIKLINCWSIKLKFKSIDVANSKQIISLSKFKPKTPINQLLAFTNWVP